MVEWWTGVIWWSTRNKGCGWKRGRGWFGLGWRVLASEALTAFEPKESTLGSLVDSTSSFAFFVSVCVCFLPSPFWQSLQRRHISHLQDGKVCARVCVLVMPQGSQINTWNAMGRGGKGRAPDVLRRTRNPARTWEPKEIGRLSGLPRFFFLFFVACYERIERMT